MRIGVLMGGISSEREISLNSGRLIIENIDKEKFEAVPIVIDKKEDVFTKCQGIDFALNVLHGKFGEDGGVQTILEALGIPYSGCGPLASALAMDKDLTKKILKASGIRTARWVMSSSVDDIDYAGLDAIGYPFFVKPNSGGSSVATNLVKTREGIAPAVLEALKYDKEVMIEEYIKGDEISTPVIDGKVYPVVAIKPKGEFFDIKAKYEIGASEEFVVELEPALQKEVNEMLLATWKELKLEGYARIDMLIRDNVPYLLEINTLPGMGPTGLMPQSFMSKGHTYADLVATLIEVSQKIER
ncbi:MAG: D-alanine--D-alanine ligase [Turicibacter sp.]|nr:D-alanine--D-alanine ligase [Turicibacter sp.]